MIQKFEFLRYHYYFSNKIQKSMTKKPNVYIVLTWMKIYPMLINCKLPPQLCVGHQRDYHSYRHVVIDWVPLFCMNISDFLVEYHNFCTVDGTIENHPCLRRWPLGAPLRPMLGYCRLTPWSKSVGRYRVIASILQNMV